MIYNFDADFSSSNIETFNHFTQKIISEIFSSNIELAKVFVGYSVIYFDDEFKIVKITDPDFNIINVMDEIPEEYLRALSKARDNNGIFAEINGLLSFDFAEKIVEYSKFTRIQIIEEYRKNIMKLNDDIKEEIENDIPKYVEAIKIFVANNNQVKDERNLDLKGFCDLDFYAYNYKNKLFCTCYASATMYMIDFNDTGFVVYGQANDYGKVIESEMDAEFCWDSEPNFERLFLKHLSEDFIVYRKDNEKSLVLNTMMKTLHGLLKYII